MNTFKLVAIVLIIAGAPVWAGVGAIVIGGVLLLVGGKKGWPLHGGLTIRGPSGMCFWTIQNCADRFPQA